MSPHHRDPEAHRRALMVIEMLRNKASSKEVAEAMGWKTKYPGQRLQVYIKKLRERGYDVPARASSRKPNASKYR